jgi:hypothetical protein
VCVLATAAAALGLVGAVQAEEPTAATAATAVAAAPAADWLDKRVAVFRKALDLDAVQQVRLRQILLDQREAVQRIWADRHLLPAERVPATRAVEERTGDRIRDILTDAQKQKYNPPKPPTPPTPDSGAPSVEAWMQRTRPKL